MTGGASLVIGGYLWLEDVKMTAKSKQELMKESRQRRIDAGLVHYREWVTEVEREKLKAYLRKLRES